MIEGYGPNGLCLIHECDEERNGKMLMLSSRYESSELRTFRTPPPETFLATESGVLGRGRMRQDLLISYDCCDAQSSDDECPVPYRRQVLPSANVTVSRCESMQ
jgi:hypothetical protein